MKKSVCCLSLLVIVSFTVAEEAARDTGGDWPQWRGPHRDAASTETGLLHEWPEGGPRLLWNSRKTNGGKSVGTGYSSIVVSGGRIFTMGDQQGQEYVFALDEKTGKTVWATRISNGWSDGGPRCTPTVDGERVYAVSPHGDLVCLNAKSGTIRWRKNYGKDFGGRMMSGWGFSESPLVDGNKLICTPGGDSAALVALDKLTGKIIWKAPIKDAGGAGYASVVATEVGGAREYVTILGRSGGCVGVDANTGKLLWRYNRIANGTANIPTPVVKGDLVFCSTGYGAGAALLRLVPSADGSIDVNEVYFLEGNKLQNHHGGMIMIGDHLYGGHGHNAGFPFCLNVKDGSFAWRPVRGPGDGSAAVVYADGCLYFRYQNNVMALVDASPNGYRLISQFNLPAGLGTGWAHPVVVHGKLFIRGQDQVLCYDVKQR